MNAITSFIKKIPVAGTYVRSGEKINRLSKINPLTVEKVLAAQNPAVRDANKKMFTEQAEKINKANEPKTTSTIKSFWSKMTNKAPKATVAPKKVTGEELQKLHASKWAEKKNKEVASAITDEKIKRMGSATLMGGGLAAGAVAAYKNYPAIKQRIVKKIVQKKIKRLVNNKPLQVGVALSAGVAGAALLNKKQEPIDQTQIIPESFEYSGV